MPRHVDLRQRKSRTTSYASVRAKKESALKRLSKMLRDDAIRTDPLFAPIFQRLRTWMNPERLKGKEWDAARQFLITDDSDGFAADAMSELAKTAEEWGFQLFQTFSTTEMSEEGTEERRELPDLTVPTEEGIYAVVGILRQIVSGELTLPAVPIGTERARESSAAA